MQQLFVLIALCRAAPADSEADGALDYAHDAPVTPPAALDDREPDGEDLGEGFDYAHDERLEASSTRHGEDEGHGAGHAHAHAEGADGAGSEEAASSLGGSSFALDQEQLRIEPHSQPVGDSGSSFALDQQQLLIQPHVLDSGDSSQAPADSEADGALDYAHDAPVTPPAALDDREPDGEDLGEGFDYAHDERLEASSTRHGEDEGHGFAHAEGADGAGSEEAAPLQPIAAMQLAPGATTHEIPLVAVGAGAVLAAVALLGAGCACLRGAKAGAAQDAGADLKDQASTCTPCTAVPEDGASFGTLDSACAV